MNILIIKDDKPGHYNQTEGILQALQEIYPQSHIEYIDIEIRSKVSRKFLRLLLNYIPYFFEKKKHLKYIKFFYKKYVLPDAKPDIIVSTGGNTANLNAWLAKAYKTKNILNGRLRGINETLFTKITTVIDLGYQNQIVLDVAPNTITQKRLFKASEVFASKYSLNGKYYTLLIGGNGAGYYYDELFYDRLADFVIDISRRYHIKWLITTSRRTPKAAEQRIFDKLETYSGYFVVYNQNPEKVLLPFLGLADVVFVTEESSSMISEAISAQKPLYTISTNSAKPDDNYKKILEKFTSKKLIKRIFLENMNDFKIDINEFEKIEDPFMSVAKQLKEIV